MAVGDVWVPRLVRKLFVRFCILFLLAFCFIIDLLMFWLAVLEAIPR